RSKRDWSSDVCSSDLLSKASISHFADGEIKITIDESIRGCEVYVIQSVSDPVNTNLMELLIMVDALRRASAAKINVVMPYYGYEIGRASCRDRVSLWE